MGWATLGGAQPFGIGTQMYQFMVFNNPNWDYKTLNFNADMATVDKIENGTMVGEWLWMTALTSGRAL